MKKIEAIIRPERLQEVQDALDELGVSGLTVTEVMGCGRQKGYTEQYRGSRANISLLPKLKVESVVSTEVVDKAVDAIVGAARTPARSATGGCSCTRSSSRCGSGPASAARRRCATRRRWAGATERGSRPAPRSWPVPGLELDVASSRTGASTSRSRSPWSGRTSQPTPSASAFGPATAAARPPASRSAAA